jgi:hypothetical protein
MLQNGSLAGVSSDFGKSLQSISTKMQKKAENCKTHICASAMQSEQAVK